MLPENLPVWEGGRRLPPPVTGQHPAGSSILFRDTEVGPSLSLWTGGGLQELTYTQTCQLREDEVCAPSQRFVLVAVPTDTELVKLGSRKMSCSLLQQMQTPSTLLSVKHTMHTSTTFSQQCVIFYQLTQTKQHIWLRALHTAVLRHWCSNADTWPLTMTSARACPTARAPFDTIFNYTTCCVFYRFSVSWKTVSIMSEAPL